MKTRVLVVDDSGFFRRRLTEILQQDPDFEVAGTAANGLEAVAQVAKLKPDVVTLDVEMPVMDGITALRRIMRTHPVPVLMVSSLTREGAQATLDALDAGAVDFIPKTFGALAGDSEGVGEQLRQRLRVIGACGRRTQRWAVARSSGEARVSAVQPSVSAKSLNDTRRGDYNLVAIGTSTGGPVALQKILTQLPAAFPVPILVVQHMPADFTQPFAERLNQLCQLKIKEAEDGDRLEAGHVLLAPGGRQMLVERARHHTCVRIIESTPEQHYHPSVDVTFSSAAQAFPGAVLALVLTGMGADGRAGSELLKKGGATVWAQNEASCVVYGMPMAVVNARLADRVLPLTEFGHALLRSV